MARSQMVDNTLLLRYDDDKESAEFQNLNTSLSNDLVYQVGEAIAILQERNVKSINKVATYIMFA